MSPDAPTLTFLLDSPMQSWGDSSRFNRRGTGPHPTKSGVVALLACARGIDKHAPDERERLAPLARLRLATVLLPRLAYNWSGKPKLSKDGKPRFLHPNRLTDYQTIGGGFDEKHAPLRKPRKAGGGVFETVQSWRDYLLDSRFAIFLQGDHAELEICVENFKNPAWGLWLGRKSCIPSAPIVPKVHPDMQTAWEYIAAKADLPEGMKLAEFDRCEEVEDSASASFVSLDQPISFADRVYQARPVRRIPATDL